MNLESYLQRAVEQLYGNFAIDEFRAICVCRKRRRNSVKIRKRRGLTPRECAVELAEMEDVTPLAADWTPDEPGRDEKALDRAAT